MVNSSMENPSPISQKLNNDSKFYLKEGSLNARIGRDNNKIINSRRYSASYTRSFREDNANKSFRSNPITISSTSSSPGYAITSEEIDPSTYSFTGALRALKAKRVYSWEYEGLGGVLNSKWSDAEKYICNPLSGEVPLECLSAKTLSGRSFRQLRRSRFTISSPLIHPDAAAQPTPLEDDVIQGDNRTGNYMTRDFEIQSSPPAGLIDEDNSSCHATFTPPIEDKLMKSFEVKVESHDQDHSSISKEKLPFHQEVEMKETREELEDTKGDDEGDGDQKKKKMGGCFSWIMNRRRRQKKENNGSRKKKNINDDNKSMNMNMFVCHINDCYKEY